MSRIFPGIAEKIPETRVPKKGSFGFRRVYFLEILENVEVLEILENPHALEIKEEPDHFLENLEI